MFCPTCGSNQGDEKRFCTNCGTNLLIISQALTGKIVKSDQIPPQPPQQFELERQREVAKGFRFAIIGGGIVAFKLFSFVFAGPFRGGSPFGFWSFIGFILLAVGISKIISHRPNTDISAQPTSTPVAGNDQEVYRPLHQAPPQPVFSANPGIEQTAPNTSELEPVKHPVTSVTEDDTRHLPNRSTHERQAGH